MRAQRYRGHLPAGLRWRWRHVGRWPSALSLALLVWLPPTLALGHHLQSGGRATPIGLTQPLTTATQTPDRVVITLQEQLSSFAHLADAQGVTDSGRFGSVAIAMSTLGVRLRLAGSAQLLASLPWGLAVVRSPAGDTRTFMGLGDARLGLGVDLANLRRAGAVARARGVGIPVRVQLVAPTGRRDRSANLSQTNVDGMGSSGQWSLLETNADANLGAGAWAAQVNVGFSVATTRWLTLALWGQWLRPLTSTSEGRRWGQDLLLGTGARAALPGSAVAITGGVDARWHSTDIAADGDRLGARGDLGVSVGLSVRVTSWLRCATSVRLPTGRRAERRVLMESVSAGGQCQVGFGG